MMDKTRTGVWLLHSTPRFPFKRDNNFYPSTGEAKAQTFICVTFKYAEFQKIGDHLLDIAAFPFDSHVPADFHDQLKKAAIKEWNDRKPGQKIQDLKSDAGTQFRSIAKKLYKLEPTGGGKSRRRRAPPTAKGGPSAAKLKALNDPNRFEGDLYLTIAKTYDTDVRVQTWGCQSGRDGSYCEKNQRHVIKVTEVKADLGGGEVQWKTTVDHSKWCISETKDLICIADVNRGLKQYERPGGALCFIHKEASLLFQGVIAISEECPSSPSGAGSKHPHSPDPNPNPDCTAEPMEDE
ncbi:deoxyribonuclease-2-like [Etheostoma spectabile]|uniref:deoxyribonuclease-2-like n=1 Tax=Etheostoma spectabile TaxID=54343 RepID=UPI0013AEBF1E|nr:deoxyribonuclease-2-like [Etheostoma spectabile]